MKAPRFSYLHCDTPSSLRALWLTGAALVLFWIAVGFGVCNLVARVAP